MLRRFDFSRLSFSKPVNFDRLQCVFVAEAHVVEVLQDGMTHDCSHVPA
jgi:hypothetical protein